MTTHQLREIIISAAFKVHNVLGVGYLEKVYENSLLIELRRRGIEVYQQYPISVYYEGQIVGEFKADLYIESKLILEIKAVENILKAHEIQLVNYLVATGVDDGLLINFGPSVVVKRKYRIYRPPSQDHYLTD